MTIIPTAIRLFKVGLMKWLLHTERSRISGAGGHWKAGSRPRPSAFGLFGRIFASRFVDMTPQPLNEFLSADFAGR